MLDREHLIQSWRSGPPAPDLAMILTESIRNDAESLLQIVQTDVLERQRVRDLPAWADEDVSITLAHYESIIGQTIEPGTPLAELLVRAELQTAAAIGQTALAHAIERLDERFSDDVAAMILDMESSGTHGVSLETLLSADGDRAGSFKNLPERIGHFRILRRIGEGGMGVVFEAEQDAPRRVVALKVVNAGVATESILRRFEHEAHFLARLQHPGIAHVFEAGTYDSGRGPQPWFAMELVHGQPLNKYAAAKNLDLRARLALIARICQAVHHAHQKGVIHRDLKPDNILITEDGQPKILDFGVARATDSDIQVTTIQTDIGQLIGTVPYMSPEQAGGNPDDLDTRSDVYALGVITYELLAGRLPYDLRRQMVHEAIRIIREEEPTRLSSINRTLRGDVEIIIGKALEKEKDRRYQSANDLATDIERYLNDEPIEARPPSATYQFRKFARRNKALVSGVAAVFVVLVAALVVVSAMYLRAEEARAETLLERDRLELVAEFQAAQLSQVDPAMMGAGILRSVLDKRRTILEGRGSKHEAIQATLVEMESSLAGINFTNVALEALDEYIFERALAAIEKQFADDLVIKARLLQTLATTMYELGMIERAIAPQAAALEIRLNEFGTEHADTLDSMNNMGFLMALHGRYSDSERYWSEALEISRRILGNDHRDTLISISNMGGLLSEQGRFSDAEPYYREALNGFRRVLGDDHLDTLISISNMGGLLKSLGRLTEAEQYYVEALEASRRNLGDDHPDTLRAIHNLGAFLRVQGRFTEAEAQFREALQGKRRVFGDTHPETLFSINSLGLVLQAQGEFAEAEHHLREVLESSRHALGDNHPHTLNFINNIGMLYYELGMLENAERYLREALEGRRSSLGPEHPDTLVSIGNMGSLLRDHDRLAEAKEYHKLVMDGLRRAFGADHQDTLTSINNMGILLNAQGRPDEAERYFREALEGRRRVLGNDHPVTLTSINNMGGVLRELGELEEAQRLGAQAVETAKRILPAGHWHMAVFLGHHARTLTAMGRFAEAEERFLNAIEIFESALGPDHDRTIDVINRIADLYDAWHEAEPDAGHHASAAEWREKLPDVEVGASDVEPTASDEKDESANDG